MQNSKIFGLSAATALALTACGGGGGGGTSPNAITLSGTAATGAPMSGASISVQDNTGAEVCESACTVSADGSFKVGLKTSAKGPFVLKATQAGDDEPQVSMIDATQSTTVNISPITTLMAAKLAPSGDPLKLSATDLSAEKITQASTDIQTALKPLLDAAGVDTNANPLTMTFKADSTGLDKALDVLGKPNIVRDASTGKAQVEVEIKTSGADDAADANATPAKITLNPGTKTVVTGLSAERMQDAMPIDGISPKIADLLTRMQTCYATAPADRRASEATLASQITAAVCKGLFVDNDPTKYLHNNYVVSARGAALPTGSGGRFTGAFRGIFSTIQGIKHDLPEYRYTIKNGNTTDATRPMDGDVVFTTRWTITDPNAGIYLGQSDVSEYLARIQNGALKLFGNQSKHDLDIRPQARREDMPAVADYAYLATGYNIGISERHWIHNNTKMSIYESVVVTSPSGKTFTFKPIAGNNYDYLGLVRSNGTVSTSAIVRLNAIYQNAATTGHPSERFTKEFWANKDDWSDEKIAAIPAQGNWKFDITLTDDFFNEPSNNVASKTFTQYRRSINRAPTVAELKTVKWPELKDPLKTALSSQASSQGYVTVSTNNVASALNIDGWEVGTSAWSPTFVKVYGSAWDEGADVSSTARKVTIRCSGTAAHCEKASGTNTGLFINTGYGYLQMTGRDNKRLSMSLNYSTRKTSSDLN